MSALEVVVVEMPHRHVHVYIMYILTCIYSISHVKSEWHRLCLSVLKGYWRCCLYDTHWCEVLLFVKFITIISRVVKSTVWLYTHNP